MSEIEVTPLRTGLPLEKLDADFSIRGLIRDVFGIRRLERSRATRFV
ncbi:MAG TPA: hypothetical protein VMS32_03620 [Verrucomicrobiae bacterium]|nr:hypothetical protein [Verrucomicrobiae bacterium]